jgi:hypothetical protein
MRVVVIMKQELNRSNLIYLFLRKDAGTDFDAEISGNTC